MFISDFAIKPPDRHRRRDDAGARRRSAWSRCQAEDRRVPRHPARRSSFVGDRRIRARRPTWWSARSWTGSRTRISGISGVDKIKSTTSDGFAQIIVMFVFEKPIRRGHAGRARRDLRGPRRAAAGDHRADRPAVRSGELPIVSLALTSHDARRRAAHALADPEIGGELRAVAGVAQVQRRRRRQRDAERHAAARAAEAAGVGVDQVVQRGAVAEPRGARRPGHGALDRADHPPARAGSRSPRTSRSSSSRSANGRAIRLGRGRPTVQTAPRSRARLALFNGRAGDRPRHGEVEGLQHDDGRATRSRRGWRRCRPTLPAGATHRGRARRRRARASARCATSRRRWSRARCSPCSSCSCS